MSRRYYDHGLFNLFPSDSAEREEGVYEVGIQYLETATTELSTRSLDRIISAVVLYTFETNLLTRYVILRRVPPRSNALEVLRQSYL